MLNKVFIEKMIFLIKSLYLKILIILIFLFTTIVHGIENKIIYKINNEIVTSFDLTKEFRYLSLINPQIMNLKKNEIFEISKNSIIKEKIKKIELLNHIDNFNLDENFTDQLIKNTFTIFNVKTQNELKEKLKVVDIEFNDFKQKLIIEALWNQLIYEKFNSKVKIDRSKIEIEVLSQKKQYIFKLSELVFSIDETENFKDKFRKIKIDIKEKGFQNSALIHSISESRTVGGEIGWVEENSMNKNLRDKIKNLEIGNYIDPHVIPGGFLILKLEDIKEQEISIDTDKEVENLVKLKTNKQLNQFSNIYFNKIKKNIKIEKI
tara:strand:- start:1112 stop:2074 length:963 start_codon:yes stop_codon:yes gene_type:complete